MTYLVSMLKQAKQLLLLTAGLGLLWTCANERAITGGPEDKQPPRISYSSPENESVNVDQQTEILIKFTEQMKQSTLTAALEIWPQPVDGYSIKTSWTWLKVIFNTNLDPNETYLLTLDKRAQDLHGNGLSQTYILAFSTGPALNAGRLRGRIEGPVSLRSHGDLLLYKQFDRSMTDLRQEPASYVFQPDDQGNFELPYLAERSYTLFYHWDRNHNKRIDADDYFGRPVRPAVRAVADSLPELQQIWPQVVPPRAVRLLQAINLADQLLLLRTDRPVTDQARASVELMVNGKQTPLLGSSSVASDPFGLLLNTAFSVPDSARLWIRNFQDSCGLRLPSDTIQLRTPGQRDTLTLSAFQLKWLNGTQRRFPQDSSEIRITAELPFLFTSDSAFTLFDREVDSVSIPGTLQKISSMSWRFLPDSALVAGHSYQWQISSSYLYAPLNEGQLDSLFTGKLYSEDPDSLGSIRLLQEGNTPVQGSLTAKGQQHTFLLKPGVPLIIADLPATSYSLITYLDENGDGRYNSGGLGPVTGSEPFRKYPDDLRVRARWETDIELLSY